MYSGDYYVGLDMGTNSVGFAVTDPSYHLLRAKGKDLWGVRLFPEAQTAADRRSHRTARRRLQRRKLRIGILNEIFSDELNKVDPGFLQRLADSKFFEEDKTEHQPYALFADDHYTDREYYAHFPTVYHLRKYLIETKDVYDIRLLYLGLHSIYKYRGNFLNPNLNADSMQEFGPLYRDLWEAIEEAKDARQDDSQIDISIPEWKEDLSSNLMEILSSKSYSMMEKSEKLSELLDITKKQKPQQEFLKWMCGRKGKVSAAFPREYDEEEGKLSFSFQDGNLEESMQKAEEILFPEEYEVLLAIKKIHDFGLLSNIMKGYRYISEARVDIYNKHQEDLKTLKKIYKEYAPEKYNTMFRKMEDKLKNYSAYVGSVKYKTPKNGSAIRRKGKSSVGELYKTIQNDLDSVKDIPEVSLVFDDMEKGTFLPKIRTNDNGVIPYQVYEAELKAILKNAESKFPFLSVKDESGFSPEEKIMMTFSFRIPYYVGPVYNDGKNHAWSVRKEPGRVYPWNFDQKIDKKKSSEEFMNHLIGHCTYLRGKQVLPRQSLMYERFALLNEFNNIQIDGRKPDAKVKKIIFDELFAKGRRVTKKGLQRFLVSHNLSNGKTKADDVVISGMADEKFQNSLATYHHFCEVLKTDKLTYSQEQMAEDIIRWSTVYADSKNFLREKIREYYSTEQLSEEALNRVLGMKFSEWGRLSSAFLHMEGANTHTGEVKSILRWMEEDSYNLMELLSSDFTFLKELESLDNDIQKDLMSIEPEDLEGRYLSAPVKRMVWQTILILREITKVMGHAPSRVFVEMTRGDGEKKRTTSRKKKFSDLYKNIRDENFEWSEELEKFSEADFRNKKLYLYFTQMGRSMYTGKPIDLHELLTNNTKYDLDHIYPRHFVKDDSLDNNLVLVEKTENAHKTDNYPIENSIRERQIAYWKMLLDKQLITQTKFQRLTRSTDFTDAERAEFINRQIVETSQAVKTITHLLEELMPSDETKVIYSKAGNVSDFRNKFSLYKCREVNDFHHAGDAYLNIVVGNVYHTKFTSSPASFVKEWRQNAKKYSYNLGAGKIFEHTVERNGILAWDVEKNQSIATVKAVMEKQTPLVTYMNYCAKGGIADQTVYSAEKAGKNKKDGVYLPMKTSDDRIADVSRYGGFTKLSVSYFFLVEHEVKGKRIRTIEAMPVYLVPKIVDDDALKKYVENDLGLINPRICLNRIKVYSKLRINGFDCYLSGKTGNQLLMVNAEELKLGNKLARYAKKMKKVADMKLTDEQIRLDAARIAKKIEGDEIGITREDNIRFYEFLKQKHTTGIFGKRPNPVGEKLQKRQPAFENLSLDQQVSVLQEIMKLSGRVNEADLTMIGESKHSGKSLINKKLTGLKSCELISQSVTGLFEQKTDLLTL